MAKEAKAQVKNIFKAKDEKNIGEAFQNKIALLICKKEDDTQMKYKMKN